jgi:membrane glycosyltransferase
LFVTPEELQPPAEILRTAELTRAAVERPGLAQAVMDPRVNALACASARARMNGLRSERAALVERALTQGLEALDRNERGKLLNDPVALSLLHLDVWTSSAAHASWKRERPPWPARERTA